MTARPRARAVVACTVLAGIGALLAWTRPWAEGDAAPTSDDERAATPTESPPPGLAADPRRDGAARPPDARVPRTTPPDPGTPERGEETGRRIDALAACAADAQRAVECIPRAIEALRDPDEGVRAEAGRVLAAAGREAVAPLIAAVREDIAKHAGQWTSFPSAASVAFDGLVEQGADLLAQALGEASLDLWAATTMGRSASLRKDLRAAMPQILVWLRGENERARQWAAQAAPATGSVAVQAVPDLAECLRSKNVQTRIEAVQALGRIGPAASSALSELRALSTDRNATIRRLAAEAVGVIEGR